jgi:hypothetical protein
MRKPAKDEGAEDRSKGQQANPDLSEEIIILPGREPNSVAHIRSPHLADPDQAKDFEKQVSVE